MTVGRSAEIADRGWRVVAHTADVIIEAWGPEVAACVEEALNALIGLCYESHRPRIVGTHRTFVGPVVDRDVAEGLLLGALDELLYVLDTSAAAPIGATVRSTGGAGRTLLDIELQLAAPDTVETTGAGPKAISRSGLDVVTDAGQVRCTFLVDV